MEQVTRIELASPAWKAGALTIVLHLLLNISLHIVTGKRAFVKRVFLFEEKFFIRKIFSGVSERRTPRQKPGKRQRPDFSVNSFHPYLPADCFHLSDPHSPMDRFHLSDLYPLPE